MKLFLNRSILTFVCCAFFILPLPTLSKILPVSVNRKCDTASEYFDVTTLVCVPCIPDATKADDAHKVPDLTKLGPRGLPVSCTCKPGYIKVPTSRQVTSNQYDIVADFSCQPCAAGSAPTEDKSRCMSCTGSTYNSTTNTSSSTVLTATSAVYNAQTLECECHSSPNYFLREKDANTGEYLENKVCGKCPGRQYTIDGDLRNCYSCPHPNMTLTTLSTGKRVCQCDEGFTTVGQDGLPPSIYGEKTCIETSFVITATGGSNINFSQQPRRIILLAEQTPMVRILLLAKGPQHRPLKSHMGHR